MSVGILNILEFQNLGNKLSGFKKKKKFGSLLLLSGTGLIISLIFIHTLTPSGQNVTKVKIGENTITTDIADTNIERAQGLSEKGSLPKDHGMLFVFEEAKKYPFWMKDMKFPIDIIWINDGGVVDITLHANPEIYNNSSLTIYKPKEPAQYVLEVNANYTLENNIEVVDRVRIVGLN